MSTKYIRKSRYMQLLSTLSAAMAMTTAILYVTWNSPALPKLTMEDSPVGEASPNQLSWIASIVILGQIPGSVIAGYLVERFGRRGALLFAFVPLFAPWMVVAFAKSTWLIIAARFVGGMAGAVATAVCPVYIGEIAEKDIRGVLNLCNNLAVNITGFLFLSVGPFVSFTALNLLCGAFPLLFLATFYFMPESPYYLIKKGKKEEARVNLLRLSNSTVTDTQLSDNLKQIETLVENDMKNKSTLWEFVSKKEYRKSLIVMTGIGMLQQLTGLAGVVSYMQITVASTSSSISAEKSSIIFGAVPIAAALVSVLLVDRMGRKPLLVISCLGCALAMASLGTYFYFQNVLHSNLDGFAWLPTTSITLYLFMDHMGIFSLAFLLMAELFATNIKGVGVSYFTILTSILTFAVIKLYEPVTSLCGEYTMFWIYAGFCLAGCVFVVCVVPETKGKTFGEIQAKLTGNV